MTTNSHSNGFRVETGLTQTGAKSGVSAYTMYYNNGDQTGDSATFEEYRRIKVDTTGGPKDAKGWRPPNPYISVAARRFAYEFLLTNEKRRSYPPYRRDHISGKSVPLVGSSYGYSPPHSEFFNAFGSPNISPNLVKEAETKCLAKFQTAQLNIGSAIAEARETVESLASTVELLIHIIIDAYSKRWDRLASRFNSALGPTHGVNTLASAWLAYQFGIQPLVNDAQGAMKAWNDQILSKDFVLHCSATASDNSLPFWLPSSNWKWNSMDGHCKRSARVILWASIEDTRLATYGKYGLNPITMLWEALGFSWLIDYVLSVGNFLSAIGATLGLQFRSGTLSRRIEADLGYVVMPKDPDSNTTWVGGGCKTKYQCLVLYRTVYSTWPTPWVYVKNPFTSGPHVANVLALLASFKFKKAQSMGPMTLVGNYPNVNSQRR